MFSIWTTPHDQYDQHKYCFSEIFIGLDQVYKTHSHSKRPEVFK